MVTAVSLIHQKLAKTFDLRVCFLVMVCLFGAWHTSF